MSKWYSVTLYHVITVHNNIFHHSDGIMRALPTRNIQWKEDLYNAMMVGQQKLSKYFADVTPTSGMRLISAHILDPFPQLKSFR
jgi:hypothetical protein